MEINGLDFGLKWALTGGGLFAFGLLFNWLVARLQKRTQGQYTAELVAVGVFVTLAGAALLIGVQAAMVVVSLFAFSGVPMIGGQWLRVIQDNDQARKEAAQK